MTAELKNCYLAAFDLADNDGTVGFKGIAPVGEAFLLAVTAFVATRDIWASGALTDGLIDLWFDDGTHVSKYGTYLSALTLFGSLTGLDPRSLGYHEVTARELGISGSDAYALQQIAAASLGFQKVPELASLVLVLTAFAWLGVLAPRRKAMQAAQRRLPALAQTPLRRGSRFLEPRHVRALTMPAWAQCRLSVRPPRTWEGGPGSTALSLAPLAPRHRAWRNRRGTTMATLNLRGLWATVALSLGLLVTGCGGSDDPPPPPPPAVGTVSGSVVASVDSAPVAGATVSVGSLSASTAADGSFTLAKVNAGNRVALRVVAAGFLDGIVAVPVIANQTNRAAARLTRAAAEVTIDPASANVVSAAGSPAQVALPANALANAATGAAPNGAVSVRITPIDPGTDPQSMPGDFTTSAGDTIESFGAINVTLKDASGAQLNLKTGSSATIRIPLASRSVNPPATIPLFYMNEATGQWVEEGSATLTGNGTDRWYEGTVTHFTTWNADQRAETIFVNGCAVTDTGARVTQGLAHSVGIDYSGAAAVAINAQGDFRVPMRRGGRASIYAEGANVSNTVAAGPSQVDITLPACLVIGSAPVPPTIVEQPTPQSVAAGAQAFFIVVATGTRPLAYQWRRNGVVIPNARGDFYMIQSAVVGDNGALFDVVVSNAAGSVTSNAVSLTVAAPIAPTITTQPASVSVAAGAAASFSVVASGTQPLAYQWQRNGVDIAGANGPGFTIVSTAIGDNGAVFRVRVSNAGGNVLSNPATLTVTGPVLSAPTITQQPLNASVAVGQAASFSVAVTGSPPPTIQWRRNGVAIAGATAASYTTPLATLGDNGALFSVVVSNSQGSVTSNDATLTVTASTADEKVKLVRLLGLAFEFEAAAFVPFEATTDDGLAFINPATVCQSGALSVTLNGVVVTPGLPVPDSGTVAGNAVACSTSDGTTYNGSTSIAYTLTSRNPDNGSATTTVNNMRVTSSFFDGTNTVVTSDVTANGGSSVALTTSIAGPNTVTTTTLTPGAGATISNEQTGQTATFASGSVGATVTEVTASGDPVRFRVTYTNLTFSVAGVSYVGNGFYELDFPTGGLPTGSGEVVLTSGGVRVGRIFVGADGLLEIEVDGVVQPFRAPRGHARR